jgi:uncharacterized membrane protein YphA (DoxX/SURF4 family)
VLWIAQSLLAAIFLATGLIKLTQPRLKMAAGPMGWAADVTDGRCRTIGLLEVLGAIGLILPGALGVAPGLVPLAAPGLALTMIGAIVTHVRYGEAGRRQCRSSCSDWRCSSPRSASALTASKWPTAAT